MLLLYYGGWLVRVGSLLIGSAGIRKDAGTLKFRDPRQQTAVLDSLEWLSMGAEVQVTMRLNEIWALHWAINHTWQINIQIYIYTARPKNCLAVFPVFHFYGLGQNGSRFVQFPSFSQLQEN